jgi:hypothetical protein
MIVRSIEKNGTAGRLQLQILVHPKHDQSSESTRDWTHGELLLSLGCLETAKGNGCFRIVNGGFNNAPVSKSFLQ